MMGLIQITEHYYFDPVMQDVYFRDIDAEIKDAKMNRTWPDENYKPRMYLRRVSEIEMELMQIQEKINEYIEKNQSVDWQKLQGDISAEKRTNRQDRTSVPKSPEEN